MQRFGAENNLNPDIDINEIFIRRLHLLIVLVKAALKKRQETLQIVLLKLASVVKQIV